MKKILSLLLLLIPALSFAGFTFDRGSHSFIFDSDGSLYISPTTDDFDAIVKTDLTVFAPTLFQVDIPILDQLIDFLPDILKLVLLKLVLLKLVVQND